MGEAITNPVIKDLIPRDTRLSWRSKSHAAITITLMITIFLIASQKAK